VLFLFYTELKREAEIWKRSADRLPFVSAEEKTVKLLLIQKVMTLQNIVRNMKRNTWEAKFFNLLEEFGRTLCREHGVFVLVLRCICFPALRIDWLHVFPHFALTGYMFSRALHWLVTCFLVLHTDWLHVFSRLALTGYMVSRASHWVVTRFPAPGTDWLHFFSRFALTGYMFSRASQPLNIFLSLPTVTCFPALGTVYFGQAWSKWI